ncbi:MAG: EAL domain-containing protein [Dehalococcoidia bacterium]
MLVGTGRFENLVGEKRKLGEGLMREVWRSGEPVLIDNYSTFPQAIPEFVHALSDLAGAAVPLRSMGQVSGTLSLGRPAALGPYSASEVRLLERFAAIASVALQYLRTNISLSNEVATREQAEARLRRQNEFLEALHEASLGLVQHRPLDELLGDVIERSAHLLGADSGYVATLAPSGEELEMLCSTFPRPDAGDSTKQLRIAVGRGEGAAGWVWENGQPIIVNNYREYPQRLQEYANDGVRALVAVPLFGGDRFIGVLAVGDYAEGKQFGDEDVAQLSRLGLFVSMAIENARSSEELARFEQRFKALVQNGLDVIAVLSDDGVILYESPSVERVLGYLPEELVGQQCEDYLHPDDLEAVKLAFREAIEEGPGGAVEFRFRHKDGSWRHFEAVGSNCLDDPAIGGIVLNSRDITDHKSADEAVRASERRFRSLIQNASDLVAVLNQEGAFTYVSPSTLTIAGYEPDELLGRAAMESVHPDDVSEVARTLEGLRAEPGRERQLRVRIKHRWGDWIPVEGQCRNLLDDPAVGGIVVNLRDVSDRKLFQEELSLHTFYEPLTGLPNKALFVDRLRHAFSISSRRGGTVAVLYLDVDRFQDVNDSLGHDAGDELLVALGERLRWVPRPEDTVARLSGDEFAFLLEDTRDEALPQRTAQQIIEVLRAPFRIAGQDVYISASIGIAVRGPGHSTAEELLGDADAAMHRAKAEGKARYVLFDEEMSRRATQRLNFERQLREAIAGDQFEVHYQPIVDLTTGGILGVEALARWRHPEHGLVPPVEFIPVAEESGLIRSLGRRVLRDACNQVRAWQDFEANDVACPLMLNVNVSPRELVADFPREVAAILKETGLRPEHLRLEITESTAVQEGAAGLGILASINEMGVLLAIDDFGTGYSSLASLTRVSVDALKIDRSLIDGLERDEGKLSIVRAVISLAHALEITVCAEGVETAEQLAALKALQCQNGQGYLFSRPVVAEDLTAILASGARLVPAL